MFCCLLSGQLYGALAVVTDLLSMAHRPSGSGSYTVVIIPLRTNLYSLDALRFYLWVRRELVCVCLCVCVCV